MQCKKLQMWISINLIIEIECVVFHDKFGPTDLRMLGTFLIFRGRWGERQTFVAMAYTLLGVARALVCQTRPYAAKILSNKRIKLSVPEIVRTMAYTAEERGSPNTVDYRIFISK